MSCGEVPARLSLRGASGSGWAFARLDDPTGLRVEGRTGDDRAWSTSKVLVVAAYLDTVVDGDPRRLDSDTRRLVRAALTRSDADAVTTIRDRIPGRPGPAMTAVLRVIGDETTVAPNAYQGLMTWSLREQVRFMAALQRGDVVSARASSYLLRTMQPVDDMAWGLGRVGATSYKGGWLRADTLTRQMGLLDGYAVAFATGDGQAVTQSDGDAAHVRAVDALAERLQQRIALDRRCGR